MPPSSGEDFDNQLGNSILALREMRKALSCSVCLLFCDKDFGQGPGGNLLASRVNPTILKEKIEKEGMPWQVVLLDGDTKSCGNNRFCYFSGNILNRTVHEIGDADQGLQCGCCVDIKKFYRK